MAVLVLATLYFVKNDFSWSGKAVYQRSGSELRYENTQVEDLVKKDTDGDGVLDWEEMLRGLDPTKAETTPGTPDATVANKLRAESGTGTNTGETGAAPEENLTETDKFARELFSTAASLNQSGAVDQATVEKIGSALAEKIQNYAPRKIYALLDIKVSTDDSPAGAQAYMGSFYQALGKTPMPAYTAIDVLEKFLGDGETPDPSVLSELNPIIASLSGAIEGMLKISVPPSLASAHLDFINGAERVMENLTDVQSFESDPIVAFSGLAKYEENSVLFLSAGNKLLGVIKQKLPKS